MTENNQPTVATRISKLSIERFRSIRQLTLGGLGRVNLITGRNNTGKSSVLEAIRILATDGSPQVLFNILRSREESVVPMDEISRSSDLEGFSQFAAIFPGFPSLSDNPEPVILSAEGGGRLLRLNIALGLFSEERDQDGSRRLVLRQPQLFEPEDAIPALVIESPIGRRHITPDYIRRLGMRGPMLRSELADGPSTPCVYVSPYGGERTVTLAALWDKIALTDSEMDVVEALRIIVGDIEAVSMVGGEGQRQTRTAIVRTSRFRRPIPLRSFGDGLNRLFGIVLSLVNAREGLLLIDEFENGMHHTVQVDVWRAVFRLARQLNIQIFATSHSWDAVEAFQKASSEDPEQGILIRLTRKGDDLIPTVFREDELAVATREHIEVR